MGHIDTDPLAAELLRRVAHWSMKEPELEEEALLASVTRDLSLTVGHRADAPKVRYRGLFLNDEEPALGGWAREQVSGRRRLSAEAVESALHETLDESVPGS